MRHTSPARNLFAALLVAAFTVGSLGLNAPAAHADPVGGPLPAQPNVTKKKSTTVAVSKTTAKKTARKTTTKKSARKTTSKTSVTTMKTKKATPQKSTNKATSKKSTSTPPMKLDRRCLVGAKVICINKSARKLYYVTNGRTQRSWDIRVGRPGYGTREGTFTLFRKERKSWSKPYQVWMPYSMYFSGGQAIHFSYEYANRGYQQGSHGCVNMRDWNGIAWLYSQAPVGTKVVVY